MPTPPKAVLFDIDGTLTDTNYLHVRAWRQAFVDAGLVEVTSWRVHRMIGASSAVLLRELCGEERDDIKDGWRRHFDELKSEIRAFPKAANLLQAIAARGIAVVLATSSEPQDVDALVDAIGAGDAVSAVTSAGDVDEAKPSPEVFESALVQAGCTAGEALAVGDSVWDVEAAGRAGLRTVTVRCGGTGDDALRGVGAVEVFDDPAALLESLDSWLVLRRRE
ncbi:MAG TPA: HAD family hydrolase [Acidimicrobiales bacterium]|nr:HAD family hydrolase [Acidimicrobiales bacterium]